MNNSSRLWVIPNNDFPQSLFYSVIKDDNTHTKELIRFVKEYGIDLDFTEDDHHEAPCMIAEVGHLVVETIEEDSKIRFFIPERLTSNQIDFLNQIKSFFANYQKIRCYSLKVLGEDGIMWKNIRNINQVIEEINSKSKIIISDDNKKLR